MFFLLSTALASASITPTAMECDTSARWQRFDESVIDLPAPTGTVGLSVTIGCKFLGVPGAVVDLNSVRNLQVLGIRRGSGEVIVAASPVQALQLKLSPQPATATLVRDGDWRRLIEAIGAVPHY